MASLVRAGKSSLVTVRLVDAWQAGVVGLRCIEVGSGMLWQAWHGGVTRGTVSHGRLGMAMRGFPGKVGQARYYTASSGEARNGVAGTASWYWARLAPARCGRHGGLRLDKDGMAGEACLGCARDGAVRSVMAWQARFVLVSRGKERWGAAGEEERRCKQMYEWRKGFPAKCDADTVGAITSALEAEGRLTPENLLEEARSEDSPIHRCFEWDDSKAAEQFRLGQARSMIVALQVKVENAEPIKKFFHITQNTGSYRSIEVLMSSEESRNMLIERARKEFESYQRKYENLLELADLFAAGKIVFGD